LGEHEGVPFGFDTRKKTVSLRRGLVKSVLPVEHKRGREKRGYLKISEGKRLLAAASIRNKKRGGSEN